MSSLPNSINTSLSFSNFLRGSCSIDFNLANLLLRSDDDTFLVSNVESAVQYTCYRKVI